MSKITHEQVRNILNKIYIYCEDIPRQEELEQYILQQEKQEKLLELYKELAMFLTTAVEDDEDTHAYTFANINNLKEQILELEKWFYTESYNKPGI